MMLTDRIQKAINLSAEKHLGQIRKADGLPYIVHPFGVAWILSECSDDEDVIVAGLLHDVLEDVKGYYFEDMQKDFGDKVALIVKGVSEDKDPNVETDEKATWMERKQKYLDHLRSSSDESILVSAADKVHNLRSMKAAYEAHGEAIWQSFNSPSDKKLWFYEEVLKIAQEKLGEHKLINYLQKELKAVKMISMV